MVFTDLPLTQEFKTLGMDDYLWVQALFNHEELCHGMTFSDLSFYQFTLSFIVLGLIPFLFAYFHTSDIRKAEPEGIHWTRTAKEDHLLLMWSWHLPPVDDFPALSQLLHEIGVSPVHHNLKEG